MKSEQVDDLEDKQNILNPIHMHYTWSTSIKHKVVVKVIKFLTVASPGWPGGAVIFEGQIEAT